MMQICKEDPRLFKDPKQPIPKKNCRQAIEKKMIRGFQIWTTHSHIWIQSGKRCTSGGP